MMVHDIAFRVGYLCKRVITFDLEVQTQSMALASSRKRGRSPGVAGDDEDNSNNNDANPPPRSSGCRNGRKKGATAKNYWTHHHHQRSAVADSTTTTNRCDVVELSDALEKRDKEYSSLFELHSKLLVSYRELERKTTEAERELTFLKSNPYLESGLATSHHHSSNNVVYTATVSTQGKDALYWHGMCRTMESQFLHAKGEVSEKNHQIILLSNRVRELEASMPI